MSDAGITAAEFVGHWRGKNLPERGASQSHFVQLCALLGVPPPHSPGTKDEEYCFEALTSAAGSRAYAERRRRKSRGPVGAELFGAGGGAGTDSRRESVPRVVRAPEGTRGWCDVWKKGHFCWEYKRQDKHYADLDAALRQLREYKDSLDNPPLLIVCDIDRYRIATNFTGHPVKSYEFTAEDLVETPAEWRERGVSPLQLLRYAFTNPEWFRPKETTADVTEDLAKEVGELAVSIGRRRDAAGRTPDPHDVAHFLMQVVFALFAEDVGLLPEDRIGRLCRARGTNPEVFREQITALFAAMETGGSFGDEVINWFNGGLFRGIADQRIPALVQADIDMLSKVAGADWSAIEPSILGTLFERSLDPDKRAQIGAHYTSREDIMLIVEPVILRPLRREWDEVKKSFTTEAQRTQRKKNGRGNPAERLRRFHERLCSARVLDPACGSGNFLYVAIQCLLDLEKEVIVFAQGVGVRLEPRVGPAQVRGIEINPYAAELARISIWIGYLKWQRENGVVRERRPILDNLDAVEERDAILKWVDEKGRPIPVWREGAKCAGPAEWPEAEFIVGNPPFLGSKLFRKWGLSEGYLEGLYGAFDLPKTSDLCCYWFELARRAVEKAKAVEGVGTGGTPIPPRGGRKKGKEAEPARSAEPQRGLPRVGLLATQGIRGGDNRTVLERIKRTGDIFMAWSDREWVLDGAAVHVSMVGFDDGAEGERVLDGKALKEIHADLSSDQADTDSVILSENEGIYVRSPEKGAEFEIPVELAMKFLAAPNPNRRSNSDVLKPWLNGDDLVGGRPWYWIVDFDPNLTESQAAQYELPFAHLSRVVKPARLKNRDEGLRERWWVFRRSGEGVRKAMAELPRVLGTTMVAKHRLFAWIDTHIQPDKTIPVFARSDDYFFGVLHSCVHELWALRMGTQLEDRPRYTPTTCFETFPLPWPPGKEPGGRHQGIEPSRHQVGEGGKSRRDRARGVSLPPAPSRASLARLEDSPPSPRGRGREGELHAAISEAARELNELRENWLNPPELIAGVERLVEVKYKEELKKIEEMERGSGGSSKSGAPNARTQSVAQLVKRSAVMAEAAKHPELKKRTLTNLYNERPAWLRLAHEKLDRAVLAAYAAVDPAGGWDPDWAKVYEPFGAGEIVIRERKVPHPPRRVGTLSQREREGRGAIDPPEVVEAKRAAIEARRVVDERILAALLRLNGERAGR